MTYDHFHHSLLVTNTNTNPSTTERGTQRGVKARIAGTILRAGCQKSHVAGHLFGDGFFGVKERKTQSGLTI